MIPLRLIVLLTITHASFCGARLGITLQAVALQASSLAVGVLMSLLMLIPTFVSVRVGRWVDRIGYRKPTFAGIALLVVAELLAATQASVAVLGVVSVLVGLGYMLAHVAVNNAIGTLAGVTGRTRAFGLMAVGFSLSALSGPMLAGFAIDLGGFSVAFGLLALLPLAAAWLVHGAPSMSGRDAAAPAPPSDVRDLLRMPALRAVLVTSAIVSVGWDLFTFLVPLHGAKVGLSASAIGLVAGAFGVGSASVRIALPWLHRRLGDWTLLAAAQGLAALGYFLFPFATTLGTMLPLGFAIGMVLGCGQPLVMGLLHVSAPAERTGEAVGLRTAITSMGQTALPLLFGGMGAALGFGPLFWSASLLLGGGSVLARGWRGLGVR